jgi:hypothetical protein
MTKAADILATSIATAVAYQRLLGRPQPAETAGLSNPSDDRLLRALVALLTGFDVLFVRTALLSGRRRLLR